jgi:hypothetical protein
VALLVSAEGVDGRKGAGALHARGEVRVSLLSWAGLAGEHMLLI